MLSNCEHIIQIQFACRVKYTLYTGFEVYSKGGAERGQAFVMDNLLLEKCLPF
jgi:hypothetical protein